MTNASQMKEAIEINFRDIEVQHVKIDGIKNSVTTFISDLEGYHNSAFFREDSNLIKELHKVIVKDGSCFT